MGGMVPHTKALNEGRIAGRLAWNVMDKVAKIDPNKKGNKVDKE